MSIDARIKYVRHNEDGSGSLVLEPSNPTACAGQSELHYDKAPEEVASLNGRQIWGGSSSIMLGETEIAKRIGYTRIEFIVNKFPHSMGGL